MRSIEKVCTLNKYETNWFTSQTLASRADIVISQFGTGHDKVNIVISCASMR